MRRDSKKQVLHKEHGDSQVVVALILIVVAIGLCILFQDKVKGIIGTVSTKIETAIDDLADGGSGSGAGAGADAGAGGGHS